MKQVGLALALVVATVTASEAQPASYSYSPSASHAEREARLQVDSELTLHAPIAVFATSMTATAALAMSLSVLAISHCDDGDCESLTRQTNGVFAGTLAAASVALVSLIWVLARSHKRRSANRALQALDVFGSGVRF